MVEICRSQAAHTSVRDIYAPSQIDTLQSLSDLFVFVETHILHAVSVQMWHHRMILFYIVIHDHFPTRLFPFKEKSEGMPESPWTSSNVQALKSLPASVRNGYESESNEDDADDDDDDHEVYIPDDDAT